MDEIKEKKEKYFDISLMENIDSIILNEQIGPLILLKKNPSFGCGMESGTIRIYEKISPYNHQLTINAHEQQVFALIETKNGELITGSKDCLIKLFSYDLILKNFNCLLILIGHKSPINYVIELENNKNFASCSLDKTIRVWNKETKQTISNYDIGENVWTLLENENKILFIPEDKDGLFLIDYSIGNIEKKINEKINCTGTNGIYKINNNLIALASLTSVYVVDIKKYIIKNIMKFENETYFWCVYLLSDGSLVSSGYYPNIIQWDINTNQLISKNMSIHNDSLPSIVEIENNILITGSYDGKIKFWKLKYMK
jgi:WD40 repeat protein